MEVCTDSPACLSVFNMCTRHVALKVCKLVEYGLAMGSSAHGRRFTMRYTIPLVRMELLPLYRC